MVTAQPLKSQDIVRLLLKLKEETPEYPVHLLEARKSAFMKQAVALNVSGKGKGGEGGNPEGGSTGNALGGSTAAQGFTLQTLIAFGLITLMLIGASLIQNQYTDRVEGSLSLVADGSYEPIAVSDTPAGPTLTIQPTEVPSIAVTPELIVDDVVSVPIIDDYINKATIDTDPSGKVKSNPGLHLGQTPGAPAAPGHGNPGNVNRPEKNDKPEKPGKPNQ